MIRYPCRVYWGSHGCALRRGHDGTCECDCGMGDPYYGPNTRFYGEDVESRGLPGIDVPYEPEECKHCGDGNLPGEPDACLGMLPGVTQACCGHGKGRGYIAFENGAIIRFDASSLTTEHLT